MIAKMRNGNGYALSLLHYKNRIWSSMRESEMERIGKIDFIQ
jgi:hypothetical protein